MKRLAFILLAFAAATAFAQTNVRVRGTITSLNGDVLSVKTREGRDVQLHLAPDAQIVMPKVVALADFQPGSYVGVTSIKRSDGRLVAKTVHAIPPQVMSGHAPTDSIPNAMMTNADITSITQLASGNELTLKYKDGEQKILVAPETKYINFTPGTRSDLKPGETIFSGARVEGDGRLLAPRVVVSKDGVNPPQ